ncbi:MAG: hypothetical protein EZS28_027010 [Streblomastix strix]|uniref:Uncharacterized protein n=1 Tax=Streblomastix strix TaxID=222440 RepID=A0A5J4V4J6_9EUKA|nr:MAG: hypothetical protein EZS28_027010 [Streblomastix strix]
MKCQICTIRIGITITAKTTLITTLIVPEASAQTKPFLVLGSESHLALSSLSGHAHLYVGVSAYRSLSQSKGSVGVGSTSTGSGVASISHYVFIYSLALFNGHVHGVGQMGCFSIVHLHPPCGVVVLFQVQ